jgi:enediyne biosynthesis protein E8
MGGGHDALIEAVTRRQLVERAGRLGLGALVASALPAARLVAPASAAAADPSLTDATLQAFADTMVPGRRVERTESGGPVHPKAIAGVDPDPGAVEADAIVLYHHPATGFDTLEPAFLADLSSRSLPRGGTFLDLPFEDRVAVCLAGLAPENPVQVLWEAAAAVPFTAFCAAAVNPTQRAESASGYRVMGLPGAAPRGYRSYSYRRRLARERTRTGNLA